MATTSIQERLIDFMKTQINIDQQTRRKLAAGSIEIIGDFFYEMVVPKTWLLKDIQCKDRKKLLLYWSSNTEQEECPVCHVVSHHRTHTYDVRIIQDLPMGGMTVYHVVRSNHFFCDHGNCPLNSFVEQYRGFAGKGARLTDRLKEFCVQTALESSCNGATRTLKGLGIVISGDTIEREVKKRGAGVVAQNLQRKDVRVLAIDDVNLRKGNASTACSVFMDGETHRVLVIAQGATAEVAEKVIRRYPSVEIISRDRDTAYAAAANKHGKIQVADEFHLVQNVHKTIKEALSQGMAHDLFVRKGDGWIRMVDSADEPEEDENNQGDEQTGLIFIGPAAMEPDDLRKRIQLAGLTERQAEKYKTTLAIIQMSEEGLRTAEIAKRLTLTKKDVYYYRHHAQDTINQVELKIDAHYLPHPLACPDQEKTRTKYRQMTIAKNARPSSQSIVAPYKETVLAMFNAGKTHREIHPAIVQEGFQGSVNAVYQYLAKYTYENGIPYGLGHQSRRSATDLCAEEPLNPEERPSRISIERVSRTTLYEKILQMAAKRRDEIKQSLGLEKIEKDAQATNVDDSTKWVNQTQYSDDIAKIVLHTDKKKREAKKN